MISQETTDAAAIKRGDESIMANEQLDSVKGRKRRRNRKEGAGAGGGAGGTSNSLSQEVSSRLARLQGTIET